MKPKVWAQRRNFSKMQIAGAISTLTSLKDSIIITSNETDSITKALFHLKWLYEKWDSQTPASRNINLGERK